MNKTIKLTIEDRYQIIKYAHQIPCTLVVRANFDQFVEKLELDEEESKQYTVSYNDAGEMVVSDAKYVREYTRNDFPVIYDAIVSYVNTIREESSGEKPSLDASYVQSITKWLDKLVG